MIRNFLYNTFMSRVTLRGYEAFFEQVRPGSRVLDIGIGNGLMLRRLHERIRELKISIHGLDVDAPYLEQCRELVAQYGLQDQIQTEQRDFLDGELEAGSYDIVFFSMSFMFMPDKAAALARALSLLKPQGQIAFFQTMETERSRLKELVKPLLKYFSSVEFGKVTYFSEFEGLLNEQGFVMTSRKPVMRFSTTSQSQVVFAKPKRERSAQHA